MENNANNTKIKQRTAVLGASTAIGLSYPFLSIGYRPQMYASTNIMPFPLMVGNMPFSYHGVVGGRMAYSPGMFHNPYQTGQIMGMSNAFYSHVNSSQGADNQPRAPEERSKKTTSAAAAQKNNDDGGRKKRKNNQNNQTCMCICRTKWCRDIAKRRSALIGRSSVTITTEAGRQAAFKAFNMKRSSDKPQLLIQPDHYRLEDRHLLWQRKGKTEKFQRADGTTVLPSMTAEEREHEVKVMESINSKNSQIMKDIGSMLTGRSEKVLTITDLEVYINETERSNSCSVGYEFSHQDEGEYDEIGVVERTVPVFAIKRSASLPIEISLVNENECCRVNAGLKEARVFIEPGRDVVKQILECIPTRRKMDGSTFVIPDRKYLHYHIDNESDLKDPQKLPNIVECRIPWELWSRKNSRPAQMNGKNVMHSAMHTNAEQLRRTLVVFNVPEKAKHVKKKGLSAVEDFDGPIYFNSSQVDLETLKQLQICGNENIGLRYYYDEKGVIPQGKNKFLKNVGQSRYFYLVNDLMTVEEIEKIISVCGRYNGNLIPFAILFVLRYKHNLMDEMKDMKTLDNKASTMFGKEKYRVAKAKLIQYLKRLLSSFLQSCLKLCTSDLARLLWGKWPHILEEGDVYFDDDENRIATRHIATATTHACSGEDKQKTLKNLLPLSYIRIMIHSQAKVRHTILQIFIKSTILLFHNRFFYHRLW